MFLSTATKDEGSAAEVSNRGSPASSRLSVGIPSIGDESQNNLRIQLAVNRYNSPFVSAVRVNSRKTDVAVRHSPLFKFSLSASPRKNRFDSIQSSNNQVKDLYPGVGNFPTVRLNKSSPLWKPVKRRSVREDFRINVPELPVNRLFTKFAGENNNDLKPTRSVLDVLQDLSRKRIHLKDDSDDMNKRVCKGLGGDVPLDLEAPYKPLFLPKKIIHDFSNTTDKMTQTGDRRLSTDEPSDNLTRTDSDEKRRELRRQLARKNNEIMASLSSSVSTSFVGNKRKRDNSLASKLNGTLDEVLQKKVKSKSVEEVSTEEDKTSEAVNPPDQFSISNAENSLPIKPKSSETISKSPQSKDRLMTIFFDMQNSKASKKEIFLSQSISTDKIENEKETSNTEHEITNTVEPELKTPVVENTSPIMNSDPPKVIWETSKLNPDLNITVSDVSSNKVVTPSSISSTENIINKVDFNKLDGPKKDNVLPVSDFGFLKPLQETTKSLNSDFNPTVKENFLNTNQLETKHNFNFLKTNPKLPDIPISMEMLKPTEGVTGTTSSSLPINSSAFKFATSSTSSLTSPTFSFGSFSSAQSTTSSSTITNAIPLQVSNTSLAFTTSLSSNPNSEKSFSFGVPNPTFTNVKTSSEETKAFNQMKSPFLFGSSAAVVTSSPTLPSLMVTPSKPSFVFGAANTNSMTLPTNNDTFRFGTPSLSSQVNSTSNSSAILGTDISTTKTTSPTSTTNNLPYVFSTSNSVVSTITTTSTPDKPVFSFVNPSTNLQNLTNTPVSSSFILGSSNAVAASSSIPTVAPDKPTFVFGVSSATADTNSCLTVPQTTSGNTFLFGSLTSSTSPSQPTTVVTSTNNKLPFVFGGGISSPLSTGLTSTGDKSFTFNVSSPNAVKSTNTITNSNDKPFVFGAQTTNNPTTPIGSINNNKPVFPFGSSYTLQNTNLTTVTSSSVLPSSTTSTWSSTTKPSEPVKFFFNAQPANPVQSNQISSAQPNFGFSSHFPSSNLQLGGGPFGAQKNVLTCPASADVPTFGQFSTQANIPFSQSQLTQASSPSLLGFGASPITTTAPSFNFNTPIATSASFGFNSSTTTPTFNFNSGTGTSVPQNNFNFNLTQPQFPPSNNNNNNNTITTTTTNSFGFGGAQSKEAFPFGSGNVKEEYKPVYNFGASQPQSASDSGKSFTPVYSFGSTPTQNSSTPSTFTGGTPSTFNFGSSSTGSGSSVFSFGSATSFPSSGVFGQGISPSQSTLNMPGTFNMGTGSVPPRARSSSSRLRRRP